MILVSLSDGKEKLNDLSVLSNRGLAKLEEFNNRLDSFKLAMEFDCGKDECKVGAVGVDVVKELVPNEDVDG